MTDLGSVLGLGIAFAGGVVSFASPCCLPLVPAYLSYMVGATGNGAAGRRTAFTHGLAFTAGFSLVFVALFLVLGALGAVIDRRIFSIVGGAILIVMGLQTAGVINISALWRDTRVMPTMGGGLVMAGGTGGTGTGGAGNGNGTFTLGAPQVRPGYGRSLAFGLLFAAGWSPCIGPILGGILGLATASTSVAMGTVLLLAYAAGLAVPFLAIALGASWVATRLTWVGRHHQAVSWVTGALLVVLGVLMLTNLLGRLAAFGTPLGL
jgi:cytochrome c-type biogenesis protein